MVDSLCGAFSSLNMASTATGSVAEMNDPKSQLAPHGRSSKKCNNEAVTLMEIAIPTVARIVASGRTFLKCRKLR